MSCAVTLTAHVYGIFVNIYIFDASMCKKRFIDAAGGKEREGKILGYYCYGNRSGCYALERVFYRCHVLSPALTEP